MEVTFIHRDKGFIATKQNVNSPDELVADGGLDLREFEQATLSFPVDDEFTDIERNVAYDALMWHLMPRAVLESTQDDLLQQGPAFFKEIVEAAGLSEDSPIEFETAQHMYVSAILSGIEIGIMSLVAELSPNVAVNEIDIDEKSILNIDV